MRFQHVRIAALAHVLPEERVASLELEQRLEPTYGRLRLSAGRLELMSGIRERRFWAPGTRPSEAAARAGRLALERGGLAPSAIGCLIHGGVSRDFLEPATASVVHARLGLAPECQVFDLSNACLGVLNGMGLVVTGEDARGLVEETIRGLNEYPGDERGLRAELKRAFASLTIGSGAAAVLLARAGPDDPGPRLLGGELRAATQHVELCQGDRAGSDAAPTMSTDSEALLVAGTDLAAELFPRFLEQLGWTRGELAQVVTHQVGVQHRRALYAKLELDPALDFPSVETLGNTGSAALPTSLSLAAQAGRLRPGAAVALLGIGSGLSALMLGVRW